MSNKDVWKVAVVGCGNIGSRHLQGLAKIGHVTEVYAVDPRPQAIEVAKQRIAEVTLNNEVSFKFLSTIDDLPPAFNLVIVATAADGRKDLVESLAAERSVGALVLEKFLFQSLADYDVVDTLLSQKGIHCWVNTPRRVFAAYKNLKQKLADAGPITLIAESNKINSLTTSAIHLIDLFAYLANTDEIELDGRGLKLEQNAGRRSGYLEFSGLLIGQSARGDTFFFRGRPDIETPSKIVIASAKETTVIDEANQNIVSFDRASRCAPASESFRIPLISEVSGGIAERIIRNASSDLPTYEESARLHRACLRAFLDGIGQARNNQTYHCNVT